MRDLIRRLVTTEGAIELARCVPDGLVFTKAWVDEENRQWSSLWHLDPRMGGSSVELTDKVRNAHAPAYAEDGSLLYLGECKGDSADQIWLRPPHSGEQDMQLTTFAEGVVNFAVAQYAPVIAFVARLFADTSNAEEDLAKAGLRSQAGVTAHLYETSRLRNWNQWQGPRENVLFVARYGERGLIDPRILRRVPNWIPDLALSADGGSLAYSMPNPDVDDVRAPSTHVVSTLAGSDDEVVLSRARTAIWPLSWSHRPEATLLVAQQFQGTAERVRYSRYAIWRNGDLRDLATPEFDIPGDAAWSHDGTCVYFGLDERGHAPLMSVDVESGNLTTAATEAAFESPTETLDGELFAIRSSVWQQPSIVRIGANGIDKVYAPPPIYETGPKVERRRVTVDDGAIVESWLLLPATSKPVPLVVLVHGGPSDSWNCWSRRWNAPAFVAAGYAVLLPDPAMSVGYGSDFSQRGWSEWGTRIYADVMAAVDEVVEDQRIDADRVAALGPSFGGYMTNWLARKTDRFRCIVTHAGVYSIRHTRVTADQSMWIQPVADRLDVDAQSPHAQPEPLRTPMLVVHGGLDYRIPVDEAVHLWGDLMRDQVDAKFLYFPDEGHWISQPGNVQLWYETIFAFLGHHLKGVDWERPKVL